MKFEYKEIVRDYDGRYEGTNTTSPGRRGGMVLVDLLNKYGWDGWDLAQVAENGNVILRRMTLDPIPSENYSLLTDPADIPAGLLERSRARRKRMGLG